MYSIPPRGTDKPPWILHRYWLDKDRGADPRIRVNRKIGSIRSKSGRMRSRFDLEDRIRVKTNRIRNPDRGYENDVNTELKAKRCVLQKS